MGMTLAEQRKRAKSFSEYWTRQDYKEDGNTSLFWLELLEILGAKAPTRYIQFEVPVKHLTGSAIFIDARIPSLRIVIEQKESAFPLELAPGKTYSRHGRSYHSVYEQAYEYDQTFPLSERSRYIVTCNFREIWIYDMNVPESERLPIKIPVARLSSNLAKLQFLVDSNERPEHHDEVEVSVQAGELVGKLYDALYKQYRDPTNEHSAKSLNILCVRIVFCLYAEDAGLFPGIDGFRKFLRSWNEENIRDGLIKLFKVLDTKPEDRDPYMQQSLAIFPYVNGGLFHDEHVEIPFITKDILHIICEEMSAGFNWAKISPTIFGAVFESTLNPETRRKGGMHYTSIENIHKVIDPLFLEDLDKELHAIIDIPSDLKLVKSASGRKEIELRPAYREKLEKFQDKLASLRFFDPACGSGNFLTETYLSIRRLENKVIWELAGNMQYLSFVNPVKVSIRQFYGIEINDFAVTVAKTALWIAESQMLKETEKIIHMEIDFLPLKTNANIHEGNALRMDWKEILPPSNKVWAMGNPPFVGYDWMSPSQKSDMKSIFGAKTNRLDYVTAWYMKAAQYIQGTNIKCAFVSTNSITQGVQVSDLWSRLFNEYHISIDFAHTTFVWRSETKDMAAVHVVIIGFSLKSTPHKQKYLFEGNEKNAVYNISPYLTEGPETIVIRRPLPLSDVPKMVLGNMPKDGGGFIFDRDEYEKFKKNEPQSLKFIHRFMMGREFINNIERYCLWLVNAKPNELKSPMLMKHLKNVQDYRLSSTAASTVKLADTPTLFAQISQPDGNYIALPKVSSCRRRYIPMGYLSCDIIAGDKLFIIPDATLYHFGVLTSNVHNAWMRLTAGRLKSDYSYNITTVYNTFPWPTPTDKQKALIEQTAQMILGARALYPDSSLADLYDPLLMPSELRKAHIENDKAVMEAYGFNWHTMKEEDCVAELMKMYESLIKKEKEQQS